jgi:hypothetical protein
LKIDEPSSDPATTAGGDLADAFRQIAALHDMMASSGSTPHAAASAAVAATARHGVFVVMDYGRSERRQRLDSGHPGSDLGHN